MMTGNIPIGNSAKVAAWNPTTTTYANGRSRRVSRKATTVVSKRNPAQAAE
jgi:hypothetical protein